MLRTGRTQRRQDGSPLLRIINGKFPLPTKPGLGFDLSEDAFKRYSFQGTKGWHEFSMMTARW